jgi:hypothetical protein
MLLHLFMHIQHCQRQWAKLTWLLQASHFTHTVKLEEK